MINTKLGESAALGIISALVTNFSGVSAGRSAIIGAGLAVFVEIYLTVNAWRKDIKDRIEKLEKAAGSENRETSNSNTNQNQIAFFFPASTQAFTPVQQKNIETFVGDTKIED
jgi:hypothetical protein